MQLRPCWVEIDTRALEDNYRFLQTAAAPAEVLAIVKADAYGHGLQACARAAVRAGAKWLGVTSVEEGLAARSACPSARIVVIGGIFAGKVGAGQAAEVFAESLTPVIWDRWHFNELESVAAAKALPVHLEIDTGMSRQGVALEDIASIVARFTPDSPLRLEAVMTHLYASDEINGETTSVQLERLDEALARIEAALPPGAFRPEWLSVGASAALLGGEDAVIAELAARYGLKPLLRTGLALYGLAPRFDPEFPADQEPDHLAAAHAALRPVLAWKTEVVSVRDIPAGAEIGYNGTFVATEPMRVALIAAGYADGLDRRLGNRMSLLVRGQQAPLVGRISMDQAVLDVSEIEGVAPGDEVVILGRQGAEEITAFDHAEVCGTIAWEVLTRITARVHRIRV
jgi:alanine racemase